MLSTSTASTPTKSAALPALLRSARAAWLLLTLLFLAVYFASLFTPPLLDDADATHANAAQHMARSGDWVTLYVNGIRYLEKPVLPYWLVAIDYHIFGFNVFATHLPMAIAVFANMVLGWVWARRAFDERAAFYAALAILSSVGVFLYTRFFIPEAILCFFLALALWSFLTGLEDRAPHRFYLAYASLAIALLAKGLIAPVFFAAAAFPYLMLTGDWRRWREFRLPTGLLLFLAIGAPWHVLAALRNPDQGHPTGNIPVAGHVHGFLYFYFVNEHFLRFLGKRYPHDYNRQPGWVFWVGHLAWLFPWSLFFPAALGRFLRHRREWWRALHPERNQARTFLHARSMAYEATAVARQERFRARTTLLLGLYAAFVLLFFSFSTNQEYYTFPAWFALLVLTAGSLSLQESGTRQQAGGWLLAGHILFALTGVGSAVALFSGLWASRHLPYVADIGSLLAHRGVGSYTLSMSHFFDMTGSSLAALRLPATLAASALLLGPMLALLMRRRGRGLDATMAVGLTMALFLVAAHLALARFAPLLSSRSMADRINQIRRPGDQLLVYGDQSNASSVLFYTGMQALLVHGRSSSMIWGSFYPDAPHIFLQDADVAAMWGPEHVPHRLFLVVPPEEDAHVRELLGADRLYKMVSLTDEEAAQRTLYTDRPM